MENKKHKILIFGLGYVGLSLAVLLSQNNNVVAIDINISRVESINNKIPSIQDNLMASYLKEKNLNLHAYNNYEDHLDGTSLIIIATPTNYDEKTHRFDTQSIESIISNCVSHGYKGYFVIKSTIPIGFTEKLRKKIKYPKILFSPEFLREGKSLYDNLHPSRIIVGINTKSKNDIKCAKLFGNLLKEGSLEQEIPILIMGLKEAEAVKLFANTFLALRVSFFNELDTFAEKKKIDSKSIINGICLDPRIGDYYNNPSFGYGGYCLPKDTKQLLSDYKYIPENIIRAIVKSNDTRKKYIAKRAYKLASEINSKPVIGIYRLVMKSNSDNIRKSAIIDVAIRLKNMGSTLLVYEPNISIDERKSLDFMKFIDDEKEFLEKSDLIIANRRSKKLEIYKNKVYSRDIYSLN